MIYNELRKANDLQRHEVLREDLEYAFLDSILKNDTS
jgi:hypothetical protein